MKCKVVFTERLGPGTVNLVALTTLFQSSLQRGSQTTKGNLPNQKLLGRPAKLEGQSTDRSRPRRTLGPGARLLNAKEGLSLS